MASVSVACLPHEEFRLLSQMIMLIWEGIFNLNYYKNFDSLKFLNNIEEWVKCTKNSYFKAASTCWCMLFGQYSEPTHYHKLIDHKLLVSKFQILEVPSESPDQLKNYLLQKAGIDSKYFDEYHKKIIDYRNRNLIHREHSPAKINDGDITTPELNTALQSFNSLLLILTSLLRELLSNPVQQNGYPLRFYEVTSPEDILAIINDSFPDFSSGILKTP